MADVKKINGYDIKDETARQGLTTKQDALPVADNAIYGTDSDSNIVAYKAADGVVLATPELPDGYVELEYIANTGDDVHVQDIVSSSEDLKVTLSSIDTAVGKMNQATSMLGFTVVKMQFVYAGSDTFNIYAYDAEGNSELFTSGVSTASISSMYSITYTASFLFNGDYFTIVRTGWSGEQYVDTGIKIIDKDDTYYFDSEASSTSVQVYLTENRIPTLLSALSELESKTAVGAKIVMTAPNMSNIYAIYEDDTISELYLEDVDNATLANTYGVSFGAGELAVDDTVYIRTDPAQHDVYKIETDIKCGLQQNFRVFGARGTQMNGAFLFSNHSGSAYQYWEISWLPQALTWQHVEFYNTTSAPNVITYDVGGQQIEKYLSKYGCDASIMLFAVNADYTSIPSVSKYKLYMKRFTITKNGSVVFKGIPAKRLSDNVPGFYDIVSNTFMPSLSDMPFTCGPEVEYPTISIQEEEIEALEGLKVIKGYEDDEYIQLEYLKSRGGYSAIDLGFVYNHNYKYEVKCKAHDIDTAKRPIFGAYNADNISSYAGQGLCIGGSFGQMISAIYTSGFNAMSKNVCFTDYNWHTYLYDPTNIYIDGSKQSVHTSSNSNPGVTMGLFNARRGTGSPSAWDFSGQGFKGSIAYFDQLTTMTGGENVAIKHFIPVRRKSDGALGFFETINAKFYQNVASEPFEAGPVFGTRVEKIQPQQNVLNLVASDYTTKKNTIDARSNEQCDLTATGVTNIGVDNKTIGLNSTVYGAGIRLNNNAYNDVAVGTSITIEAYDAVAVGHKSEVYGTGATAVGANTIAYGDNSVNIGNGKGSDGASVYAPGSHSITIGYGIVSRMATNSVFIGSSGGISLNLTGWQYITSVGFGSQTSASYATVVGASSVTTGTYSCLLGYSVTALGNRAIAIGTGAIAGATETISIGSGATTRGNGGIQIGNGENTENYTFCVGLNAQNYKLLQPNGIIPYQRLAGDTPTDGQVLYYDDEKGYLSWKDADSYTLPAATTSTLGGVKVGSGLSISGDGTLSSSLPTASANTLGGVKVGSGLSISNSGVLSADVQSNDFEDIGGDPYDNTALADALNGLQDNIDDVQDQVDNLQSIGRFLAMWDADTGTARYLSPIPFTYAQGDYFIVSAVAAQGGTNYMPDGGTYTAPSTVTTSDPVETSDMYFYTGSVWVYLPNHARAIAVDHDLSTTSTNPVENATVTNALNTKLPQTHSPSVVYGTDEYGDQVGYEAGDGISFENGQIVNTRLGGNGDSIQLADVFIKERPELPDLKYSYKGNARDIYFKINSNYETLRDNKNDIYFTISKFSNSNKSKTYRKHRIIDDCNRFKTDKKLYCWKYDTGHTVNYDDLTDPQWVPGVATDVDCEYFYTTQDYNGDYAAMWNDDPQMCIVSDYNGDLVSGNWGTNFNEVITDYNSVGNYYDPSDNIVRCPEHDIDSVVSLKNDYAGYGNVVQQNFNKMIGRLYKDANGNKIYCWSSNWDDSPEEVFCYVDSNTNLPIPNEIPDFMGDLSLFSTVSQITNTYTFIEARPDLNWYQYNERHGAQWWDVIETLRNSTQEFPDQEDPKGTGGFQSSWNSYWLDYPIRPIRLAQCKILIYNKPYVPEGETDIYDDLLGLHTFQEIDADPVLQEMLELQDDLIFALPIDTYYFWMRMFGWQKTVYYGIENNHVAAMPYERHNLRIALKKGKEGCIANSMGIIYGYKRPQVLNKSEESGCFNMYLRFNTATGSEVAHHKVSRCTGVDRKIYCNQAGHQAIV